MQHQLTLFRAERHQRTIVVERDIQIRLRRIDQADWIKTGGLPKALRHLRAQHIQIFLCGRNGQRLLNPFHELPAEAQRPDGSDGMHLPQQRVIEPLLGNIPLIQRGDLRRANVGVGLNQRGHAGHHREQRDSDQHGSQRAAADPFGEPFQSGHGAGENRLMPQPAFQIEGHRLRRAVATRRIFFQALEADGFQIAIQSRLEQGGTPRLLVQHLPHRLHRRASGKRRLARQQFIEDRAETIDIHGGRQLLRLATRLLRRHVTGRAEHRHRARERAVLLHQPGQPEVRQMRLALRIEQHVPGLDVPMKDAALMRVVDGARQLREQLRRVAI